MYVCVLFAMFCTKISLMKEDQSFHINTAKQSVYPNVPTECFHYQTILYWFTPTYLLDTIIIQKVQFELYLEQTEFTDLLFYYSKIFLDPLDIPQLLPFIKRKTNETRGRNNTQYILLPPSE